MLDTTDTPQPSATKHTPLSCLKHFNTSDKKKFIYFPNIFITKKNLKLWPSSFPRLSVSVFDPIHTAQRTVLTAWAHLASYTVGTGLLPGLKRPGRGVDHPPHLEPNLKSRAILLPPLRAFMACSRVNLPLPLPLLNVKRWDISPNVNASLMTTKYDWNLQLTATKCVLIWIKYIGLLYWNSYVHLWSDEEQASTVTLCASPLVVSKGMMSDI